MASGLLLLPFVMSCFVNSNSKGGFAVLPKAGVTVKQVVLYKLRETCWHLLEGQQEFSLVRMLQMLLGGYWHLLLADAWIWYLRRCTTMLATMDIAVEDNNFYYRRLACCWIWELYGLFPYFNIKLCFI